MKVHHFHIIKNYANVQRRVNSSWVKPTSINFKPSHFSTSSQFQDKQIPSKCDVCIIGGGAMGSSTAFWLKHHPKGKNLNVVVIERDPGYSKASTPLSHGGIRYHFSCPDNIQLSKFSMNFISRIQEYLNIEGEPPVDVNFRERGYLILASTPEGAQVLHENHFVQKQHEAHVELLSPEKLKTKFPWMNTDGVVLGSFGTKNEGWFDPWLLLNAFKKKAISLGVQYINGEVISFDKKSDGSSNGPTQLQIKCDKGLVKDIEFDHCVLAAGYNSGVVGKLAGIGTGKGLLSTPIPVEPRKRYTFIFDSPDLQKMYDDIPILIDGSGAVFRPSGSKPYFLGTRSPECEEDEPKCDNLDVDHSQFENDIWPLLMNRVPALGNLKVKSAYGGFYDYNTFDQNGILGTHPSWKNFHLITGFSGHGIQKAAGAGHAMMELILEGEFKTIDLSRSGFERIIEGKPLLEKNVF